VNMSSDEESINDIFDENSANNELEILKRESSLNLDQIDEIIQNYYKIKVDGYNKALEDMRKYPFIKLFIGMLECADNSEILYYLSSVDVDDDFMTKVTFICQKKIFDNEKILKILKSKSSEQHLICEK
ncbi:hypothetical protein THOM_2016, partial [Trachipleistophora hominis]